MVEQETFNFEVVGSNPATPTKLRIVMSIGSLSCPLELEVLLYYYKSPSCIMQPRSTAISEFEDRLIDHGLLEMIDTMQQNNVRCTDKGRFYVAHLLSIPFPVEERKFTIPS